MRCRDVLLFAAAAVIVPAGVALSQPSAQPHAGQLRSAVERLSLVGNVLYVAAHPDDENTRLIAWLVGQRHLRTGYLSLTRGDGGQNLIGPEQAELFGLIRTRELLEARRIDGGEQMFTRAVDFGYSKSADEALAAWRYPDIVAEVVWAIRKFRPDVIVTRFPIGDRPTHGHHTASALIAREAFDAAADPDRFPEQLKYVEPWQARRILWNKSTWWKQPEEDWSADLPVDVGVYNPLLGLSYGEIAGRSRSMHKSQGFGAEQQRGSIMEYFELLGGDAPSDGDFLGGIDFTWTRAGGDQKLIDELAAIARDFSDADPAASIPALLDARAKIAALDASPWRDPKLAEVDEVIAACAGLWLEATADAWMRAPGERLEVKATALNRTSAAVELVGVRFPDEGRVDGVRPLAKDEPLEISRTITLSDDMPVTTPYWLREPHEGAMYTVDDLRLLGLPVAPAPLAVEFDVRFGETVLTYRRDVDYKWVDPVEGERRRPLEIHPVVTLTPERSVVLFPEGAPRKLRWKVEAGADSAHGKVRLQLPAGWEVDPATQPLALASREAEGSVEFTLYPPAAGSPAADEAATVTAVAEVGLRNWSKSMARIDYPHIPPQVVFTPAEARLVGLDLDRGGIERVGYIPGAGDEVAEALEHVGYDVRILDEEALDAGDFDGLDAIVVGVRAFNVNDRMRFHRQRLLGWVQGGGTLVVQYNAVNRIADVAVPVGPYPFDITRDRVTDETAPMRAELPDHPVLTTPNRIEEADYEGWVQERGLYFAGNVDERYSMPLASHDAGEPWLAGGLLAANYGKGRFVYTGLSFFRQLPAGVPGAYRLFANILALGKSEPFGPAGDQAGDGAGAGDAELNATPAAREGADAIVAADDDLGFVRD